MPSIDIHVQANISKNHEDNFIGGTVVFYSKPNEGFIKYMLDNNYSIPTVPCNRKGDGCDTHITELQSHNDNIPDWSASKGHTELDMVNYATRIVNATMEKCQSIGVDVNMIAKDEDNFTYQVSNLDIKTDLETTSEHCDNCNEIKPLKMYKFLQDQLLCKECGEGLTAQGQALAEMAMEDQAIEDMEKNEESDDENNMPF